MGTFRGYMINMLRINGIAMFVILQVLCVYFLIVGLEEISATLRSLWYTAAYDELITSGAIIALKAKKLVQRKGSCFYKWFPFLWIFIVAEISIPLMNNIKGGIYYVSCWNDYRCDTWCPSDTFAQVSE